MPPITLFGTAEQILDALAALEPQDAPEPPPEPAEILQIGTLDC